MQVEICSIREQVYDCEEEEKNHTLLYDPLHLKRHKCKNSELEEENKLEERSIINATRRRLSSYDSS